MPVHFRSGCRGRGIPLRGRQMKYRQLSIPLFGLLTVGCWLLAADSRRVVTAAPGASRAGDIVTAWASQTQDGQDEWLLLEYDEPMIPTAVLVYETYNPGALVRVTAFKLDGEEVELWKGQDPTTPDNEQGVSEIAVKADFKTNRIK